MKQPFIELPKREPLWTIPIDMAEKDTLIKSLQTDYAKLEAECAKLRTMVADFEWLHKHASDLRSEVSAKCNENAALRAGLRDIAGADDCSFVWAKVARATLKAAVELKA